MKGEPVWRRYLRFFGVDAGGDFDDEVRFHLEAKIEELVAGGCPPRQARAEALRQFGPVRSIRRECLRVSRGRQIHASRAEYFAGWLRDVGYAARSLVRAKAASATAILILAVGIGANTAVFTLLDRLLLAPLPITAPSQLVQLSAEKSDRFTPQAFENLRDHNRAFSGIAAEAGIRVGERRGHEKIARPADGLAVSGNYFQVLGVSARLGRVPASGDDARVVVISYRFWTSRFNRSVDALGRTIYLNDMAYTIIGVLPRGFFGLHRGADCNVYVPIASLPHDAASMYSDGRWLRLYGRLRRGTARASLQIECEDISAGTPGAWGEQRRSLWLLEAIVVVLLVMGCVNVACLLLARCAVRQREIAIRLSLGGKRTRVLRQVLLESCLLALAAATAGLALALGMERLLVAAFQWQDRPIDLSIDGRMLGFGAALSLATTILFGLAPALRLWRGGGTALTGERGLTPRFGAGRFLVTLEVALSLVLVAGAAVFLRSFQNLRAVPTGFSTERVSYVELGNTTEPDSLKAPYYEAILLAETLRRAPGVEAAALSDMLPFDEGWIGNNVTLPGDSGSAARAVHLLRVDGGYFDTLRVTLQAGRTFTAGDDGSARKVAILTEGTARRLFRGENPLGRHILLGAFPKSETEIVGVVNDIKFGSVKAAAPNLVFQPLLQGQNNGATTSSLKLHVRSRIGPTEVAALVRSRIGEMRLPVSVDRAAPLEDAIAHSMLNDRVRMQASGVFGVLALLLITAGIYGLMAYSVAVRTREIGIRIAVGSRPGEIVAMVLGQGLRLTAAGVILGIPGALAVMKAVSKLVFGLAPFDWTSVALAALILCVTGILASVAPAWRAAHLDAVEALRVE